MTETTDTEPRGELALRTVAMPDDTNPAGDIFGGWIVAQMDLAAGTSAAERAQGRTVTAAISHLDFLKPVKVGDVVCVYTEVTRVGNTSMTLAVDAWARPRGGGGGGRHKVTAAEFVMVAVDEHDRPRPVSRARHPRPGVNAWHGAGRRRVRAVSAGG